MKETMILVYSGWLDSTTVLYDLLDRGYEVVALSVNYGQKHSHELQRAKEICDNLNVENILLDLSQVNIFKNNGLVNEDIDIKEGLYDEEVVQSTFVPNRNSILANYALSIAMERKAKGIALGIHSEDVDTGEIEYPDCSPEFVEALKHLAQTIDFTPYIVDVPFSGKSKVDVIKRGVELWVPFDKTISCYKGWDIACGKCWTCIQRLSGFRKNKAIDPIEYETLSLKDLSAIGYDVTTLTFHNDGISNRDNDFSLELEEVDKGQFKIVGGHTPLSVQDND